MRVGAYVGIFDPLLWREFALEAEELGFESFWVPEHLVLPYASGGRPGYPAAAVEPASAHPFVPPETPLFDPLVALADIAARTAALRLCTGVLVPGLRHPFVTARAILTLDLLSAGRLEIGVGAGWLRQEWDATEMPFERRGERLDEVIEIWRGLWREPSVAHHGRFYSFDAVAFEPKPFQTGGPPILIGGMSEAARNRATRIGDGWYTMLDPDPAWLIETVAEMAESRPPPAAPLQITVQVGDPRKIETYARAGVVDRIVVGYSRDPDETGRLIRLAAEVMGGSAIA